MIDAQRKIIDKSIPEPNSGCWLWCGYIVSKDVPYGRVYYRRRYYLAHRLSYMSFNGMIESGKCVCHKCDNTYCVNPDHLFIGTDSDNYSDLVKKGPTRFVQIRDRVHRGHPDESKLSVSDRILIRKSKLDPSILARQFGVSEEAIHKLLYFFRNQRINSDSPT